MLITSSEQLIRFGTTKRLWQGVPGIEVTPKGRIFLTFYSGGTTEEPGNFCAVIQSNDGIHFSEPIAVAYDETQRCYDPCLWIDPLGRLWFIWSQAPTYGVYASICKDPDAQVLQFDEPFFIGQNVMMNKPTVLSSGEWAFPIAVWKHINTADGKDSIEIQKKIQSGSYMYVTEDQGLTFKKVGFSDVEYRHCDEHMILEMQDHSLRMYVRTEYGIGIADSYDGGIHWNKGYDSGLGGPCSRFHIRRLKSGRILLINHYRFTSRNNLTAMLSEDDGKTFPYKLMLDERSNVSYPDAVQIEDGSIYITYDRERGACVNPEETTMEKTFGCAREILVAHITESDILSGRIVNQSSYLKRIGCKLENYDGEIKNPYFELHRFSNEEYAAFVMQKSKEFAIERVFDDYGIFCANMEQAESRKLDSLIEEYQRDQDESILVQIISIIRHTTVENPVSEDQMFQKLCDCLEKFAIHKVDNIGITKQFSISSHYADYLFTKKTGITIKDCLNSKSK